MPRYVYPNDRNARNEKRINKKLNSIGDRLTQVINAEMEHLDSRHLDYLQQALEAIRDVASKY